MKVLGVLGLGSIGLRHAQNLIALGATVVGFDPDPARRLLLSRAGGRPVETRDEAIRLATAIVVASPSAHHLDDLTACVATGRHVMVEKPIAHQVEGVLASLKESESKRLVVLSGFNLRFHACVSAAKTSIDAGVIGQPIWASIISASYLPEWRPDRDYRAGYAADPSTGGVVFDVIHEIDLARHLLGSARVEVASAARTGLLEMASEDIADFVLVHDGGARSTIHLDYVSRPPIRTTRIVGTEGSLDIDLRTRRLVVLAIDGSTKQDVIFPGSFAEDYVAEMAAFIRCLDGEEPLGATGWDGLKSLEIAIEVRKKAGLLQA